MSDSDFTLKEVLESYQSATERAQIRFDSRLTNVERAMWAMGGAITIIGIIAASPLLGRITLKSTSQTANAMMSAQTLTANQ